MNQIKKILTNKKSLTFNLGTKGLLFLIISWIIAYFLYSFAKNKNFNIKEAKMEQEIGRIKKSETTDIVVRVDDFGGVKGITIREYLNTERYTGFTKQGTRIPADKWEEFKSLIEKINPI